MSTDDVQPTTLQVELRDTATTTQANLRATALRIRNAKIAKKRRELVPIIEQACKQAADEGKMSAKVYVEKSRIPKEDAIQCARELGFIDDAIKYVHVECTCFSYGCSGCEDHHLIVSW
jgi:hypothetical protein